MGDVLVEIRFHNFGIETLCSLLVGWKELFGSQVQTQFCYYSEGATVLP